MKEANKPLILTIGINFKPSLITDHWPCGAIKNPIRFDRFSILSEFQPDYHW